RARVHVAHHRCCLSLHLFFSLLLHQPPTSTLFPYTTLFRSIVQAYTGGGLHDLRAAYACERYESLTGYAAPVVAGERLADRELRSEEHTSELQSRENLVCRLLLEKKKT